jgi:hypothetical protein
MNTSGSCSGRQRVCDHFGLPATLTNETRIERTPAMPDTTRLDAFDNSDARRDELAFPVRLMLGLICGTVAAMVTAGMCQWLGCGDQFSNAAGTLIGTVVAVAWIARPA